MILGPRWILIVGWPMEQRPECDVFVMAGGTFCPASGRESD